MKFEQLNLIEPILRAVQDEGYTAPSPIQEQAIPPALAGKDVLGCAQTGTGKTAAFAIPILQRLSEQKRESGQNRVIKALVLTPTRELALQIAESFKTYGHYLRLHTAVIFGGVSQNPQVNELKRGVDILVATPGRLNDLINQGYIDLQNVQTLVLDEADRMLDMGFIHDVEKVIARVPKVRQTLFFSATMPESIMRLCDRILTDPVKVAVTPVSSTVDVINQSLYFVDKVNKRKLLADLLENEKIVSALVFTFTKHGADRVVKELERTKIKAQAIHGNKSQNNRQNALNAFKNGEIRVLVATDIAARGIDIDELSHVINYDLPNIPETYVHRIGRTGRAGLGGTAISFCCFEEKEYLRDIEKLIGKKIPVVEEHPYPMEVLEIVPKQPRPPRPPRDERGAKQAARGEKPKPKAPPKQTDAPKSGNRSTGRNYARKNTGKSTGAKTQFSRKG
ncbi:DEAD/DEAH box helicase [Oscillospiraceae bacterium PP1C4]